MRFEKSFPLLFLLVVGVVLLSVAGCSSGGEGTNADEEQESNVLSCTTAADCPIGFDCINGECTKEQQPDADISDTDEDSSTDGAQDTPTDLEIDTQDPDLDDVIVDTPDSPTDTDPDLPDRDVDDTIVDTDPDLPDMDEEPAGVCGPGNPCTGDAYCLNGQECVPTTRCNSYSDCNPPETTCIDGLCRPGCKDQYCGFAGECNEQTGYCEKSCPGGCDEGFCCNLGYCGPCCWPECGPGFYCTDDLSKCAEPTCPCCAPYNDCRSDPSVCKAGEECDMDTGLCRKICPNRCPAGMTCSSHTNYECAPRPREECSPLTTCSDPCYYCHNGFTFFYCLPDTNRISNPADSMCYTECLQDGVVTFPGGNLCCAGLIECHDNKNFTYCCKPENCDEGNRGCVTNPYWMVDGDEDWSYGRCEWEPDIELAEAIQTVYREGEDTLDIAGSASSAGTYSFAGASGGKIACLNGESGDALKFNVSVPDGGRWRIRSILTKGRDHAKVRLIVDRRTTENDFDGYDSANTFLISDPFIFGEMTLTAGSHEFELRVISHNPASTGYKTCVDVWVLEQIE